MILLVGLSLTVVAAIALLRHILAGGRLSGAISVGWIGYIILLSGMLVMVHLDGRYDPDDPHKNYSLFLFLTATIGYLIGLSVIKGVKLARYLPSLDLPPNHALLWIGISFCASMVVLFLATNLASRGSFFTAVFGSLLGGMLIFSFYGFLRPHSFFMARIPYAFSGGVAVVWYLTLYWSRRPVLGAVCIVSYWFYHRWLARKHITSRIIVMLALSVVLLGVAMFLQGSRGQRVRQQSAYSFIESINVDSFQATIDGITIGYHVGQRVIGHYQDAGGYGGNGYHYGGTYANGLLFFITRTIWPGKPESGGYYATVVWTGTTNYKTNVSPNPVVEAYMNFGIVGPFIVFLVAGMIVRLIDQYLALHSDNLFVQFIWLSIVFDFMGQYRGDFTSMYVQPITRIAFVFALVWGISWGARKCMGKAV